MRVTRRHSIKAGLLYGVAIATAASPVRARASDLLQPTGFLDVAFVELIRTLRTFRNEPSERAALLLERSTDEADLSLHLRNAQLEASQAKDLARALRPFAGSRDSRFRSFSVSYNPGVGNSSLIALARALPLSLHEIGFVGCNIRDAGAKEILEWAYRAPHLKLLCIEQNIFSKETESLFREFNRINPACTVVV